MRWTSRPTRSRPADLTPVRPRRRRDGAVPRGRPMPADATMPFRAVEPTPCRCDRCLFRAVSGPAVRCDPRSRRAEATRRCSSAVVGHAGRRDDALPRGQPTADATDGPAHVNGDLGQAELRTLIHSILAGLKPREREVIELSFRHDLHDNDLAIALDVSAEPGARPGLTRPRSAGGSPRCAAHRAYQTAGLPGAGGIAGRLGWAADGGHARPGQLAHGECQTCAHHGWGALRPTAFSRLLPLAPLPPELREQVLSRCYLHR